jgi:hypothetical protein
VKDAFLIHNSALLLVGCPMPWAENKLTTGNSCSVQTPTHQPFCLVGFISPTSKSRKGSHPRASASHDETVTKAATTSEGARHEETGPQYLPEPERKRSDEF